MEQCFFGGGTVFELQIDFVQVFFKTVVVLQSDYRTSARNNGVVVTSGTDSVKMKPQCVPASGRIVGMGRITVQHDDLPFLGMIVAVFQGDLTGTVFNIHDQKAVQGGPAQAVSWKIAEISGNQRIEEQILCLCAGGIDVVIGIFYDTLFFGKHGKSSFDLCCFIIGSCVRVVNQVRASFQNDRATDLNENQ